MKSDQSTSARDSSAVPTARDATARDPALESASACRVTVDQTPEGYERVVLESDVFRLAVLPGKGSDFVSLLHSPSDTDFMWWTTLGLRPASEQPSDFQSQYEGGWQEIFPNLAGDHVHDGVPLQAYGEVSLMPWSYQVVTDQPDHVAVCFQVELRALPFRLEKTVHLRSGVAGFTINERAINLGEAAQYADWGHHITFGEPFLTPGTRLELPSLTRSSFEIPERGAAGGFEALGQLLKGQYRVMRPDGLGAQVLWDASVWPHLWFWRDFAGEVVAPYFGRHFNIGLEVFSSPPAARLQDNIDSGTALRFEAGQARTSWLQFEVIDGR